VDAVRDDPTYPPDQSLAVSDAMKRLLTPELLSILVELASQQDQSSEAVTLLTRLGPAVVDRLVDLLATEESPTLRRTLIDLLADVGKGNVNALVGHLKDPRWYVVRNLASVLGKTGHPKAVPPLRNLMRHDDHRVRLEALRALATLQRSKSTDDLIAALEDENQRVRLAALTLLRSSEADGVDAAMVAALENVALDVEEAKRLAEILVERGDPQARKALENLSSSRSFLSRSNRAAKQAARDALKK
jgi:HEAT repeat protein